MKKLSLVLAIILSTLCLILVVSSCGKCKHSYDEGVITKEATCTEKGTITYTCTSCGEAKTEEVAIKEHTFGNGVPTPDATCETAGKLVFTCTSCGLTKDEVIEAKGHNYNSSEITKEATCKEDGILTKTCTDCGDTVEEVIPSTTAHTYDKGTITKEPNCVDEGLKVYTCKICKATKEESVAPNGAHAYDDGEVIKAPTCTEEGSKVATCQNCGDKNTVVLEKLPIAFTITVVGGESLYLPQDGKYTLTRPEKIGYEFIEWVDLEGNTFPESGAVTSDITIKPQYLLLGTTTIDELVYRAENGVEEIRIDNDIVIDRTVYITGNTSIFTNEASGVKLIRDPNFAGELLVIGENANGESLVLENGPASLTIAQNGSPITIDGNRDNVTVDVVGSAIFIVNSATLNIYDGTSIINNIKVGNERSKLWPDYVGTGCTMGGAGVFVAHGSFMMYGGLFDNNSVNIENVGDENNAYISSYGGSIYNCGTFEMFDGTIKNSTAVRGGAIYSRKFVKIYKGTIENNKAYNKGGAICTSESPFSEIYLGKEGSEKGTVVFRNNVAISQGGVILGYHYSPITIYDGVLFEGNRAEKSVGGVISTAGPLTAHNAEFIDNYAYESGGAIYQYYDGQDVTPHVIELDGCIFDGNTAGRGGAILMSALDELELASTLVIKSCQFIENTAVIRISETTDEETGEITQTKKYGSGGAIYVTKKSTMTITDTTFSYNTAELDAGAIYLTTDTTALISSGTFTENTATRYGGAIRVNNAESLNIVSTTFKNNGGAEKGAFLTERGGAIYASDSIITTTANSFNNNSAQLGGAIYVSGTGKLTDKAEADSLVTTTFDGNMAQKGGAICAYGLVELDGTSLTSNTAIEHGGAIYAGTNGVITIKNANVSNNIVAISTNEIEKHHGGAIYVISGSLTVLNSRLENNTFEIAEGVTDIKTYGGAIAVSGEATLAVDASTFNNNSSSYGGAISVYALNGNTASVVGSSFTENTSTNCGGAMYINNAVATVSAIEATRNSSNSGGALYISECQSVTIDSSSSFVSNEATTSGGAICVGETATVIAKDSTFTSNSSKNGGAIFVNSKEEANEETGEVTYLRGSLTVSGSTFEQNKADKHETESNGGAIYVNGGVLSLSTSTFNANTAIKQGGAIFFIKSASTVSDTKFLQNSALGNGGAIYITQSPEGTAITTSGCELSGNTTEKFGGAVYVTTTGAYIDGEESIENSGSLFSGNTATNGGAIGNYGSVSLYGSRLTENTSSGHGGAYFGNTPATLIAKDCEFSSNQTTGEEANGGALYLYGAAATLDNCKLDSNKSTYRGGAIYVTESTDESLLATTNCELTSNTSVANGGAIYLTGTGIYSDNGSTFKANSSAIGGAIATYGIVTLNKTNLEGNTATDKGGAICIQGKDVTAIDITSSENNDIYILTGNLYVSGAPVIGNVYVPNKKFITVNGALTEGASIGFTIATQNSIFAKPDGTNITDLTSYKDVFVGIPVYADENGNLLAGYIIFEEPSYQNGYTVEASGTPSYQWYTYVNGEIGELLDGQTTATLNEASQGVKYVCVITYNEEVSLTTEPTMYAQAQEHPICGGACDDHDPAHEMITWIPVTNAKELEVALLQGGSFYLATDIELEAGVVATNHTNLCLNGKTLTYIGTSKSSVITVNEGVNLTITDCSSEAKAGYIDPTTGLWVVGTYEGDGEAKALNLTGGIITGGRASYGGAIYVLANGTLNMYAGNLVNNTAGLGGAIYLLDGASASIDSVLFAGNLATTQGGAIRLTSASANITNCQFVSNKAIAEEPTTDNQAGAIHIYKSTALIENTIFDSNLAYNAGGAIYITQTPTDGEIVTINCQFINNSTEKSHGGAIYVTGTGVYRDGEKDMDNGSSFEANVSPAVGGAIGSYGNVTLNGTVFEANNAKNGGAVGNYGTVSAYKVKFIDNTSTSHGGAYYGYVYNGAPAILTAEGCEFTGNYATGADANGGAAYVYDSAATLVNCKLTSNKAEYRGGAIYITEPSGLANVVTTSCEFTSNQATSHGGAIYVTGTGAYVDGNSESAENGSIFSGNSSATLGGAICSYGTTTLYGTAIESNTATDGDAIYVAGGNVTLSSVTSNENNDIYLKTGNVYVNGTVNIGNIYVSSGKYITVNGELTSESVIGFTLATENSVFAKPDGTNVTDITPYMNIFTGMPVYEDEDGNLLAGYIIFEQPSYQNGYTVEASGTPSYQWYYYEDGAIGNAIADQTTNVLATGIIGNSYVCVITYSESKSFTTEPFVYSVEENHPICGDSCDCGDTTHESTNWLPITNESSFISALEQGGNYYLATDIELSSGLVASSNTNICLSGKTIKYVGEEKTALITVNEGINLTITDCSSEVKTGYIDPTTGLWVAGTYAGDGEAKALNLTGGIITGGNNDSFGGAIYVLANGTLNMYAGNMVNNTASHGGAIYLADNATANLDSVVFASNLATVQGGALRLTNTHANITNCQFVSNKASATEGTTSNNGGAIHATGSSALIENTTFDSNHAFYRGGAIYLTSTKEGEEYVTINCSFVGNAAETSHAGAIYVTGTGIYRDGEKDMDYGSTFKSNTAATYGGAIATYGNITLYLTTFESNATSTQGGAIAVLGETTTINNCTFEGNTAETSGGAVAVVAGTANLNNNTFVGNTAKTSGGAVYAITSTLTINGGSMTQNKVTTKGNYAYMGGAVAIAKTTTATIKGVTFTSNGECESGGAIGAYGANANLTVEGCVFDSNSAVNGGAIYAGGASVVTIKGIEAKNNKASSLGAVIYVTSANTNATIESATLYNNNTAKDITNGFAHLANATAVISIYKAEITMLDAETSEAIEITDWTDLILNPKSGTINELVKTEA